MLKIKKLEKITLTKSLYKKLHKRLVNTVAYKQLFNINKNLGSFQEPSDYAQEVLICLNKKLKSEEVEFYSEPQLWTYCNRILNMLLLRQHRDYSLVVSRKATLVDIDSELESGKSIDDIAGLKLYNKLKSIEYKTQLENFKNYIMAITEDNIKIININKLFELDKNSKLINLFNILEDLQYQKIELILKKYKINKNLKETFSKTILDILEINYSIKNKDKNYYSINTELNSRDKYLLKNLKEKTSKNPKISINDFKLTLGKFND